ncbi:MAG: trehalose-phosphatase [Acidobacteriales bacterium]|nr:trehalose-phosphatase [Terriglobales bacterium]
MRSLYAESLLEEFFARFRTGTPSVLMLDYDGTLAPFQTHPDDAGPYHGVPEMLESLIEAGTRVVLVSGRRAREVRTLLGLRHAVEIWGSHGVERLQTNGKYWVVPLPHVAQQCIRVALEQVKSMGLQAAAEQKPGSVALHWRGLDASTAAQARHLAFGEWKTIAIQCGMTLLLFDGGVELRVTHPNKGDAVLAVCRESDPETLLAYLGDDVSDEDAFRALRGRGLTVLVRQEYCLSQAEIWLKPPQELHQFLRTWLTASGGVPCSTSH